MKYILLHFIKTIGIILITRYEFDCDLTEIKIPFTYEESVADG